MTQRQLHKESDNDHQEPSREQQVQLALHNLSSACEVQVELRPFHTVEDQLVTH